MSKCSLYYDGNCPICTNYVGILRRKLNPIDIQFIKATEPMDDFKFILDDGSIFYGKEAIAKMANRFPVLLDYFWMLPDKFKLSGLQSVYKASSIARAVIKKVGGCNCGK